MLLLLLLVLEVVDTLFQRIGPVGDFQAEGCLYLGLVEYRVAGAYDFRGELVAVTGLYVAGGVAGIFGDCFREVVPRADAFVGVVVDAVPAFVLALLDDVADGGGQVIGIGGGSCLVEDDFQAGFRGREVEHRFQEVLPVLAVQPGRADDEIVAAAADDSLFAMQLGLAVNAGGVGCLFFPARGVVPGSAEDVVGGDMYEQTIVPADGYGQVLYGLGVEQFGQFSVVFGLVYIGIGGTVDDDFHVIVGYHLLYGGSIGDVELDDIGEDIMVGALLRYDAHLVAELAVGAGD